jgi:hypothetical protein
MQSLNQFLTEDANKNLHLEHLEDLVFFYGIDGVRAGINFIRSIRDMLAGVTNKKVDLHVKWDGAPAIFAGTDPEDGKFFVGTKGVFAKNAKLVKSNADIKKYGYSGGLADKLQILNWQRESMQQRLVWYGIQPIQAIRFLRCLHPLV